MRPHERSLSYLEHAITVAGFGSEEGRAEFTSAHAGEDLVELAMRHIPPDSRADYVDAARPLATCGIPEVETRARQIIAFASLPAAPDPEVFGSPEWQGPSGREGPGT